MKNPSNGIQYDVSTATHIAHDSCGQPGDLDPWSADLYIADDGRWFLRCTGGPKSRCRNEVRTNRGDSCGLIWPLTWEQAYEFLVDSHADHKLISRHFGDRIVDG